MRLPRSRWSLAKTITRIGQFFYAYILSLLIFISILFAQDASDLLEDDINLPSQTLTETTIEALLSQPINFNTATLEDLIKIPYLTPVIANQILKARDKQKQFNSLNGLLEISGIDKDLLEQISPFITLRQASKINTQIQIRSKLDSLKNYNRFQDYQITSRTNFNITNNDLKLRFIIATDKDKKEKSAIDFLSASIGITTNNQRLVVGNYLLSFASHLIFASPYSYSNTIKNFSLSQLKSINELTAPYENKPLFGIAYVHNLNKLNLTGFMSSRRLDAEIKDKVVKRVYYYTRYTDSLSLARRDQLQENLVGTRLTYLFSEQILIGTTIAYTNYDKPFAPTDSNNSFYGQSLTLAGIDMQAFVNNYFLKSELAYSCSNGFGFASQIIGDWKFLRVNFNLYTQQKNFFSPHSRWKTLTNRKGNLSSSFNVYYNLSGFKMYLLASTKQDFTQDSLPARIQYRVERKQNKFNLGLVLKSTYKETELKTYGARFDLTYHFSHQWSLTSRIEDRYSTNKSGFGRLLQIGTKYDFNHLRAESRIYLYNISSTDCKIYAYEPIRSGYGFYEKGIRLFSGIQYRLGNYLNLNYYLGYTKTSLGNFDSCLQLLIDM